MRHASESAAPPASANLSLLLLMSMACLLCFLASLYQRHAH